MSALQNPPSDGAQVSATHARTAIELLVDELARADVGLDRDEVLAVLSTDAYGDMVDADEEMARSIGATGVPLFIIDRRYGISGAQPAETILQVLERAWAEREAA